MKPDYYELLTRYAHADGAEFIDLTAAEAACVMGHEDNRLSLDLGDLDPQLFIDAVSHSEDGHYIGEWQATALLLALTKTIKRAAAACLFRDVLSRPRPGEYEPIGFVTEEV